VVEQRSKIAVTLVAALLVAAGCTAGTRHAPPSSASGSQRPSGTPSSTAAGIEPAQGTVREVVIPASTSAFQARPAEIWLPPAAAGGRTRLPVVELLHGVPGGPVDWVTKDDLQSVPRSSSCPISTAGSGPTASACAIPAAATSSGT
jgi:hypothetical protein